MRSFYEGIYYEARRLETVDGRPAEWYISA